MFTIHADGSSHGGRHFFDSSRENAWEEAAAEEYALEDHSLRDAPHPAQLVGRKARSRGGSMRGGSAGLAALQAEEGQHRHGATWVAEDGSVKNGSAAAKGRQGGEGSARGGKGGSFGNAVVQIEEPSEKEIFEWGAYLGSLPKKLKGECMVHGLSGPTCGDGCVQDACWWSGMLAEHCPMLPCCQAGWISGCPSRRCARCSGPGWERSWVSARQAPPCLLWPAPCILSLLASL
jgi:hypothetical protein